MSLHFSQTDLYKDRAIKMHRFIKCHKRLLRKSKIFNKCQIYLKFNLCGMIHWGFHTSLIINTGVHSNSNTVITISFN